MVEDFGEFPFKKGDIIIATQPLMEDVPVGGMGIVITKIKDSSYTITPIEVDEVCEAHFLYKHIDGSLKDRCFIMPFFDFFQRKFIIANQALINAVKNKGGYY